MNPLEPQQPVKVGGVPGARYVGQTKTRIPGRDTYSSMELLFYLQGKGARPTYSKEWSGVLLWAEKHNPEMARDMISGDVEVQADIIAWPDSDGKYSERVQPNLKKGKHAVLLQGFTAEGTPDDYVLKGGKRKPLKDFPQSSGRLTKPLNELGLPEGAYLFSDSNPEKEQGLRTVFRGHWAWLPDEGALRRGCRLGAVGSGLPLGFPRGF